MSPATAQSPFAASAPRLQGLGAPICASSTSPSSILSTTCGTSELPAHPGLLSATARTTSSSLQPRWHLPRPHRGSSSLWVPEHSSTAPKPKAAAKPGVGWAHLEAAPLPLGSLSPRWGVPSRTVGSPTPHTWGAGPPCPFPLLVGTECPMQDTGQLRAPCPYTPMGSGSQRREQRAVTPTPSGLSLAH